MNTAKKQSEEDGKKYLKERFIEVEKAFICSLKYDRGYITHSGTLGDATENNWISLLQKYLPNRYKVAKAFAVDHLGNTTEQLDCLIYDAHFTPTLFGEKHYQYVPAEAVYASFEVKQSVTAEEIEYASKKIASLRALKRTSAPVGNDAVEERRKPILPILGGLFAMNADWAEGLKSDAFQKNIGKYTGDECLDLVLTAESGFCDRLKGEKLQEIIEGEGALVRGLFRLLTALREKKTVPAVEWEAYESVFGSEN